MGKTYPAITDDLRAFVDRQHVFFVATAPAGHDGHVNCSPKGLDSLRVLGPARIAYVDYVGSGAETLAHLRENGRIVIMLCAFDGPPRIVRFHGRGRAVEPADPAFAELLAHFTPESFAVRAVIDVEVERISDSCGFGVPLMEYQRDRTQLPAWAERKGEPGIARYKREKNAVSLDGLAALRHLPEAE